MMSSNVMEDVFYQYQGFKSNVCLESIVKVSVSMSVNQCFDAIY